MSCFFLSLMVENSKTHLCLQFLHHGLTLRLHFKNKDGMWGFNCPHSLLFCQGGQSDSGMGLSSDNMTTLKRLESLAGRPLSIMALAYVHYATQHHSPIPATNKSTQTNTDKTAKHPLGHPPTELECRRCNCCTTFCSAASFLFCNKQPCVRDSDTKKE